MLKIYKKLVEINDNDDLFFSEEQIKEIESFLKNNETEDYILSKIEKILLTNKF